MSLVFCFLLNRVHFIRDTAIATSGTSRTRAELCEILAVRLFRAYGDDLMHLTLALTTSWPVYNGVDPGVLNKWREERDGDLEETVGNAIEVAILGKAKRFIKSTDRKSVV